ncbi:MAG: MFS transporter [Gammaproteobacteria bacterium]|nr:MFS transporter [Gammaproteobacteria bacterium]
MDKAHKIWWALIGIGISAALNGLDLTIVNTAFPVIQHDLHASISQLQWAMICVPLFFSAFVVPAGQLGDIIGRRKVMYIGLGGFALVSLGAGLATSALFLIIMRALQGLLSGLFFPCAIAAITHTAPADKRGRMTAIFFTLLGAGLGLGPAVGGVIMTIANWRWIFFINIPLVIISFLICLYSVSESKQEGSIKIDWWGTFYFIITVASLVFVLNEFKYYGWTMPIIIAVVMLIVSLIGLIISERRAENPLIDISLYLNCSFILGTLIANIGISIGWTFLFLIPFYLYRVLAVSIIKANIIVFVMTIMTMLAPLIAGHYFDKGSKKTVVHAIFLFDALALLLASYFSHTGPLWLVILTLILVGSAWGAGNMASMPLAIADNINNSGVISGALITNFNVVFVLLFTIDMAFFHYGVKQHNFIIGIHYAFYFLLAVVILTWLWATALLMKLT